VFCRDYENTSWLSGVIVSLRPLTIQVQGWPIAMSFNYVCQNIEGKLGDYLQYGEPIESELSDPELDSETSESHMENILQTYVRGAYRFKYPPLVRKELDQSSEIIRHLATNDVVHVKSLQLHDDRIRAKIKGGGFVTLYNFVTNREMATKDVVQESDDLEIPKDKICLIGERGKKIKAIRAAPNTQIKVVDEKNLTIDDLMATVKEDRHNCLVRITGSSYATKCSQLSIRDLLTKIIEQEEKRKVSVIRNLQKQHPRSDNCSSNPDQERQANSERNVTVVSRNDSVDTTWEMQKQQHGANGCWHTRKFKNKGKHRAAPRGKAWKRNYYLQRSKQKTRKPNRKYTIELPNKRRLSL